MNATVQSGHQHKRLKWLQPGRVFIFENVFWRVVRLISGQYNIYLNKQQNVKENAFFTYKWYKYGLILFAILVNLHDQGEAHCQCLLLLMPVLLQFFSWSLDVTVGKTIQIKCISTRRRVVILNTLKFKTFLREGSTYKDNIIFILTCQH